MAGTPAGIDAHELLLEKTVAIALTHMTGKMLSKEGSIYIEENSVTPTRSSATDILSLMDLHGKTWIMEKLPESLAFLKTTATSPNPLIPKIAILGLQKLHAELNRVEGVRKAEDFLQAFYKKTMQVDDPWVNFSVEDETFELSPLDIFCITALAVEDLSSPRTESEAASSTALVASSTAVKANFWEEWTRYLFSDVEITTACTARYRDLMMISLRSLGHPDARSIFPGMGPIIHEAMTECIQNLRPSFGLDYAQKLYNRLLGKEGSSWIEILSADSQVSSGYTTYDFFGDLSQGSRFAFRRYFIDCFFPEFLIKAQLDLRKMKDSSFPSKLKAQLAADFPNTADPQHYSLLESQRWTFSPENLGYFLESLAGEIATDAPCLKVLLSELAKLNQEQSHTYHRDLGLGLSTIDECAKQLLLITQQRKKIKTNGYDNPSNHVAFDEQARAFIQETDFLFLNTDESKSITTLTQLNNYLSESKKSQEAIQKFLSEEASFSHAAITSVFSLLFDRTQPLEDRLRYLHQVVLIQPSPVNEIWLSKFLDNRECFAREVNRLVLYALTNELNTWTPTLASCLKRLLETFSKMESLETYVESLRLDIKTLDTDKKKELENQIKFKQDSYPTDFVELLSQLLKTHETRHPIASESAALAMAEADAIAAEPTVEDYPPILGLYELYFKLCDNIVKIATSLRLLELSPDFLCGFVLSHLGKIQNGFQLAKVITALGGKEISLVNATRLLTPAVLGKIQNSFQVAEVIKALGGKDLLTEHQGLLLTEAVLGKIQNSNELAWVIEALGGKEISPRNAELLFTPAVLGKIQNGYELTWMIESLGGKEISLDNATRLLTRAVLGKIQNCTQLTWMINTVGVKDLSTEHQGLLFTPAVLGKIQDGFELAQVMEALGGKEISPRNAELLFTPACLEKIQNGFQLAKVITALGGKDLSTEHQGLLLTEAVLEKIQQIFQLVEMINALGGPEISLRNTELLFTPAVLKKIQNGYDLAWVIKVLGGKDLSTEHQRLFLTEAVLEKIQDGDQLARVIKALGGKYLSAQNRELFLREAVLEKIQNGDELAKVIKALGGKDLSTEHQRLFLTETVLAKIQNGYQLAAVIEDLGGSQINQSHLAQLIKTILLPKAMRLVDSMGCFMGCFAKKSLGNFIKQCYILSPVPQLDHHRNFIDAAKKAKLYGPKRVADSDHLRSSLAILTTALIETGIPEPIGHPPEN